MNFIDFDFLITNSHKCVHTLQLFVHCDVVICDARNPLGGVCNRQCSKQESRIKGKTCLALMIAISCSLFHEMVTSF